MRTPAAEPRRVSQCAGKGGKAGAGRSARRCRGAHPNGRSRAIYRRKRGRATWPGGDHGDTASWYAASTSRGPGFPALLQDSECDVCVVGGGYSGLTAALRLAELGADVMLLEANRVGWGASGRNGGQALRGQRVGQRELERVLGETHARRLWQLGCEAVAEVVALVERHRIACDLRRGSLYLARDRGSVKGCERDVRHMQEHYGERALEFVEGSRLSEFTSARGARVGILDRESVHLHPLRFALGLARACAAAGVRIHEQSRVIARDRGTPQRLLTQGGTVRARQVILACNGYLGDLDPASARFIMPLNSFMIATAPLPPSLADSIVRRDLCAADSRFVVNYWRRSDDGRLLFGGGETYTSRFPGEIGEFVRPRMLELFPQLQGIDIDYAWGGTLAITRSRLPYLRALDDNTFCLQGYSGHGVALAALAGRVVADASHGLRSAFDAFASIPEQRFPGGTLLRAPLQVAGMLYFGLRDRIAL